MPFFHDEPRAADTAYIGMHHGIHTSVREALLIAAIPNRYLSRVGTKLTDGTVFAPALVTAGVARAVGYDTAVPCIA
jgi:hypothetical protein